MKKIMVGSKNPRKIEAVREAFSTVWPEEVWQVEGIDVASRISNQPMSDEECIKGATNRAEGALIAVGDADFGVGLESGIAEYAGQWLESAWVVVKSKEGEIGMGSSVRIPVPEKIMALVREGLEVGDANDTLSGKENTKQSEGHFGLMTNNHITRSRGLKDGVIAALAHFLHPELN